MFAPVYYLLVFQALNLHLPQIVNFIIFIIASPFEKDLPFLAIFISALRFSARFFLCFLECFHYHFIVVIIFFLLFCGCLGKILLLLLLMILLLSILHPPTLLKLLPNLSRMIPLLHRSIQYYQAFLVHNGTVQVAYQPLAIIVRHLCSHFLFPTFQLLGAMLDPPDPPPQPNHLLDHFLLHNRWRPSTILLRKPFQSRKYQTSPPP